MLAACQTRPRHSRRTSVPYLLPPFSASHVRDKINTFVWVAAAPTAFCPPKSRALVFLSSLLLCLSFSTLFFFWAVSLPFWPVGRSTHVPRSGTCLCYGMLRWAARGQFRSKPGPLSRPLPWVSPYHRRLDWCLWIAALGHRRFSSWFPRFLLKLVDNDREVCNGCASMYA